MDNSNYLGTEKVGTLLRKFAIPCICSLIISCLYNIVDQIFVGNGVGYLGNAATGVIFPITFVGWGLSLFFGDGATAALSVSLGKGETKDIHRSVGSAIIDSILSVVVVVVIAYLWGDSLLRLIGATDANIQMAHDYGVIIFAMMPLAMTQNTLASIIRADGSPKYAMAAMLTGAIINIIGDPVAIFVLDMGIKGAAWATILGQFVSFVICAAYLGHSKTFQVKASSFKPSAALLNPIWSTVDLWCGHSFGGICGDYETLSNRPQYRHWYRRWRTAHCGLQLRRKELRPGTGTAETDDCVDSYRWSDLYGTL